MTGVDFLILGNPAGLDSREREADVFQVNVISIPVGRRLRTNFSPP